MELRHLRYFVAVAEEQNITRAASRLHISQPPLSRQIQDLEHMLEVALFTRSGKSLKLTPSGAVFLKEARAVIQRADEAIRAVKESSKNSQKELHVGYAPSPTVEILPKTLRRFQRVLPTVRIVLHDKATHDMLESLREGSIQAALMVQVPKPMLKGLEFQPIASYPICVALSSTHKLARRAAIHTSLLGDQRLITYCAADYPEYQEWLATVFPDATRKGRPTEEHDSATSLIAAVESGRGVSIVPSCLGALAGPRLRVRPLAPAPPHMVVGLAHRPNPSVLLDTFKNCARETSDSFMK